MRLGLETAPTRLAFLLGTLWFLCAATLDHAAEPAGRQIALREGWLVKQLKTDTPDVGALARESASPDKTWLAARLPAQVHDVLLAHGLIPDPHVSTNATASAWVGEKDWAYVCRFPTPENIRGPAFLRFEGFDTLADVFLNGVAIRHFENMFREHAVEVKERFAPPGQPNTLVIVFSSPLRFPPHARLPPGDPNTAKHKNLRKCHSDFGSYLGATPHAVKVGVYRDIVLDLPEQTWIEDVCVRTELAPNFQSATVRVQVQSAGSQTALHWTLADSSGHEVSRGDQSTAADGADFAIPVADPKLWWPRMHGPQNLYTLEISLRADERLLDRRRTTFAIREVKPVLTDPATGEKRFRFDINGQPIFLRGGDWVPLEGATHVWQPERAVRLLDLAEHGNMNILRVWVVNDSMQPVAGKLVVQRLTFDGKAQGELETEVTVKPGEAKRCLETTELGEISLRSEFLHATFAGHDAVCLLIGERNLHPPQTHLTARRADHRIEITTEAFARQITLEFDGVTGAVFTDNFFDLIPGGKRTIDVLKAADGATLTVRALNADPIGLVWKP
jgi:Glycosyl hydrolases family 2/Ig-fold domain/Mannosidase Ig/CBM-like domain